MLALFGFVQSQSTDYRLYLLTLTARTAPTTSSVATDWPPELRTVQAA
jgi:hypothetical protein